MIETSYSKTRQPDNPALRTPRPAPEVVTFGETMVLFQALPEGPLRYAPLFTRAVAGAESNLAIALARLGVRARWIGRLGADPFGDLVAGTLAGEGVDVSLVIRDPDAPTGLFFREFRGAGDPSAYYYRRGSAASRLSPEDVRPEWIDGAAILHVTGITPALGPATGAAVEKAMRLAQERGIAVSFDPNLRRKLWPEEEARETLLSLIPLCDLFLPGIEEASFLIGKKEPEEYGPAFLSMGPQIVALKLGGEGSLGYAGDRVVRAKPYTVASVVDPIGAGDAYAAGFLSALLDGPLSARTSEIDEERLRAALARANVMGALATQFKGDWEGLPTLAEMERILADIHDIRR